MPSTSTQPPRALRAATIALALAPAAGVLVATGDLLATAVALALGPVAAGGAWALAHRAIGGRIERLADCADAIAAGDLRGREALRRGGMGRVGRALDAVAAAHEDLSRRALLLDAAPIGIVSVDAGGRVVHANPAATTLLRTTLAELHGRSFHAAAHGAAAGHEPGLCPLLDPAHDGRTHSGADTFVTGAGGPPAVVEWAATPIVAGGATSGVAIFFREVAERRRLEERVRRADRMEAVSRLAEGVAHEFNNLLAVVLSTSNALARELPEGELRADAEEIGSAARRGAALVQRLREGARRRSPEPQAIDVAAMLSDLQPSLAAALAPAHQLLLRTSSSAGRVRADSAQLEEAIRALVLNAREAMPHGGTVTVAVGSSGDSPGARWTTIEVRDTGAGLPPEVQARLFEPFFPELAGSGPARGLAPAYEAVKQAGGEVVVDSDPAKGTAVTLFLPRVTEGEQLTLAWEGPSALRGDETVLVLEDDAAALPLARATLSSLGYRVLAARSEAEADAVVREHGGAVHVAVVSAALASGGGVEAAASLRARFPDIAVIFVADGPGHPALARAGVLPDRVLVRPLVARQLAEQVAATIRSPRPPRSRGP